VPKARAPVTLILAEASVELVPRQLRGHSSVVVNAKRQGRDPARVLLDSSFHHRAMRGLPEAERRGRPDIAHFCLLLAQGSRLNAAGRLRLYLHTRDDIVIAVKPETRLPRVYDRFKGLIEQVLVEGAVPRDEQFLRVEEGGLASLVGRLAPPRVLLLTPSGKRTTLQKLFPPKKPADGTAVLVGAFPHGDFTDATRKLAGETASVADEPMEAWAVVGEVLHRLADVEGHR
jgi:rRNA small subunit pseudouridine methyltransferase Nep1